MAIFSKSTGYSGLKFCVGSILTHHYAFIDIIVVLVGRLSITNFVIKIKNGKTYLFQTHVVVVYDPPVYL